MKETVPGKRGKGRPRRRWLDCVRKDLARKGLHVEDAQDRFCLIFQLFISLTHSTVHVLIISIAE